MGKFGFTLAEITAAGGGCRSNLYAEIAAGRLKAKKRGRSTIILAEEAERYFRELPDFTPRATTTKTGGAE